jgi:hypothetical protein
MKRKIPQDIGRRKKLENYIKLLLNIVKNKIFYTYSPFTFVLDQSRLWKFGELYGKTVAE